MIAVIQRVASAAVQVENKTVGEIGQGLLILLGVAAGDSKADADLLAAKIVRCRIFSDADDRMNLSVKDVGGGALVVSNFTLLANYKHGNRPDFLAAAKPAEADALYTYFTDLLRAELATVQTGEFGADMRVMMQGDGPVTIVMDSEILKKKKESAV